VNLGVILENMGYNMPIIEDVPNDWRCPFVVLNLLQNYAWRINSGFGSCWMSRWHMLRKRHGKKTGVCKLRFKKPALYIMYEII